MQLDPRPTKQEFDVYRYASMPKQYPLIGYTKGTFDTLNGTVLKVQFEVFSCKHIIFLTRDGAEAFVNKIIAVATTPQGDKPFLYIDFYHYSGQFQIGMTLAMAQKLAFAILAECDTAWHHLDEKQMFDNVKVTVDDPS